MHTRLPRALAAPALLLLLAAPTLAATTYFVAPSGKDTNPGTSAKPFQTIQHGINAAQDGDFVTLKSGTYTGPGDVDLDFGGKNITVNSLNGASKTIIDCAAMYNNGHRAFYFHSGETNAIVSGLTIKNGNGVQQGGGIYNSANITLLGCILTNNIAYNDNNSYYGNAIYNSGTISLTDCTFTANGATYSGASCFSNGGTATIKSCTFMGNIGNYGAALATSGTATVTGCNFTENSAGYAGGGIQNYGMTTLTSCTFSKNTASYFGGGAVTNGDSAGIGGADTVIINNCAFSGNKATNAGGAVLSYQGTATLTDCTFSGNTSDGSGGGFYNQEAASLTNCAFIGNKATSGNGGGFADTTQRSSDIVTVTNCVFSGNETTNGGGGAIYNSSNSSSNPLNLQFCTFAGNNAGGGSAQGGAVKNDGMATVKDCVLYGNTASKNMEIGMGTSGSPVTTVTYSDIKGGYAGTGNIDAKPLFVRVPDTMLDPPDYGNLHLSPGSPCIGQGVAISGVTTDKDGITRKDPPTLGAYEVFPRITTISPAVAAVGGPAFTLTVNGLDFAPNSLVEFNGVPEPTTYVSQLKLTAAIPAKALATVRTVPVVVNTAHVGTSAPAAFAIKPVPVLSSLSPSSVAAGSGPFTLTVTGTGFVGRSVVLWKGTAQPTTFVSSTTLTAAIPASLVKTAGTAQVVVSTPQVAVSNSETFTVTP